MSIPTSFDPIGTLVVSPLPPGYVRVESVGSKGAIMDSGIVSHFGNHLFICDCRYVSPISKTEQILLGTNGTNGTRWTIGWWYNLGSGGNWGWSTGSGAYSFAMAKPFERHIFKSEDKAWYIDDVKISSTGTANTYNKNWFVGTWVSPSTSEEVRLYGTSIFDKSQGIMLANYVPCKKVSDGTFHMYDTARNQFAVVQGKQLTE